MMRNSLRFPKLMSADILRDLPDDEKAAFLDGCGVRFCEEPTALMQQGEPTEGMFLVAHGSVEIGYMSADGYHAIINHSGPGAVLGVMEAIAGRACAATAKAFAATTVLICPTPLLFQQLKSPVFIRNLAAMTCDMMQRDNSFKTIDRFYTAEQRICSYISQLTEGGTAIRQSQTYLAQIVGCSRQTINKELGLLKEQDIITVSKSSIIVLDQIRLKQRIADLDAPHMRTGH